MAKSQNQNIYSSDADYLRVLEEEFTFIGRRTHLSAKEGRLTVFAMPATWKRKQKKENRHRRRDEEVSYEVS